MIALSKMSSSKYQFPPSSPLLSDANDYHVAAPKMMKGQEATRGRAEYPTPNPSSSLYRSSSPALDTEPFHEIPSSKTTGGVVSINSDFNILNPDKEVLRIPLISTQNQVTVGRSSKACDFYLGSKDRNVSRCHVSISYNAEQIVLTCMGRNGLAVRIPKACHVIETNSKNNFVILENKTNTPLSMDSLEPKKTHLTIKLDAGHTEFTLRKQETITFPRFNNVILEINNHVMLLNPLDILEDVTDDEMPELIQTKPTEPSHTPVKKTPVKPAFKKLPLATPTNDPVVPTPHTPSKNVGSDPKPSSDDTPSKVPTKINAPKSKPHEVKLMEPVAKKQFSIFEDKPKISQPEEKKQIKRQLTPLADKTNTMNVTPGPKRKAVSEEPPRRNKKQKVPKTEEVDSTQSLENLEEINNILINHLAFSRLSSTPASFLKTISVLTSNLSLNVIRTCLNNIGCVGVIYREGKDAAGKPLEEEYYYIPENDSDTNRTSLVASIKGHGGLRACRKTHKQYYWKKPAPIKK